MSIKTVSRVVNKESGVRESTRKYVQKAIDKLGYAPNISARSLAGSHSFLLGLIYEEPNASYVLNIQNGILESCREEGFDLLIHPCDHGAQNTKQMLADLVSSTRLAGLILIPPLCDDKSVTKALNKIGVPFVRVSPKEQDNSSSFVVCDDKAAAYEMTCHLIKQGHTRIALLKGHPDHSSAELRLKGFKLALQENKISVPKAYIQQGEYSFQSGRSCAAKLLKLKIPPTAIFASNDDMAAGVIAEAHKRSISMPTKLSVVGFDDALIAQQVWPTLSTVKQPVREMAHQAAKLLIAEIRGEDGNNRATTQKIMLNNEIIIRESISKIHQK